MNVPNAKLASPTRVGRRHRRARDAYQKALRESADLREIARLGDDGFTDFATRVQASRRRRARRSRPSVDRTRASRGKSDEENLSASTLRAPAGGGVEPSQRVASHAMRSDAFNAPEQPKCSYNTIRNDAFNAPEPLTLDTILAHRRSRRLADEGGCNTKASNDARSRRASPIDARRARKNRDADDDDDEDARRATRARATGRGSRRCVLTRIPTILGGACVVGTTRARGARAAWTATHADTSPFATLGVAGRCARARELSRRRRHGGDVRRRERVAGRAHLELGRERDG